MMQHNNSFLGWLSPEIQTQVLNEMSFPDLVTFSKTRSEKKEGIKEYMVMRWTKLFRSYVDKVDDLIAIMDRTGAVI